MREVRPPVGAPPSRRTIGRPVVCTAVGVVLLLLAGLAPVRAADAVEITHPVITNPNDGHRIHATLFKPPGAGSDAPVPIVLHGHGWGGSRDTDGFEDWLAAGYGVLSFDQRGFGGSNDDKAHIQDPLKEGLDVVAIVDYVASLDWVAHDVVSTDTGSGPETVPDPSDPVLFAIGGSYGGGYQLAGAFADEALRRPSGGHTRFNALAPEITWFDLNDSLGPQGVPRSLWGTLLTVAGAQALPPEVLAAYAWASTTGRWPDGTLGGPDLEGFFADNGPRYWVEDRGLQLDIPVLVGQGITDNLFNLNQGLSIFDRTLTPSARERSLLIGYNGGHALPNVVPSGVAASGDPCSAPAGGFGDLRLTFFDAVRSGAPTRPAGFAAYNLATLGNACVRTDSVDRDLELDVEAPLGSVVTTTGIGAVQHLPVTTGPLRIAGIPEVSARLSTLGLDARAFLSLSIGTSPLDARVIQNNVLPVNRPLPTLGEAVTIELPGVAVDVPPGQTLFLTVSPVADAFVGMQSRVPGIVTLEDIEVHLPSQP